MVRYCMSNTFGGSCHFTYRCRQWHWTGGIHHFGGSAGGGWGAHCCGGVSWRGRGRGSTLLWGSQLEGEEEGEHTASAVRSQLEGGAHRCGGSLLEGEGEHTAVGGQLEGEREHTAVGSQLEGEGEHIGSAVGGQLEGEGEHTAVGGQLEGEGEHTAVGSQLEGEGELEGGGTQHQASRNAP